MNIKDINNSIAKTIFGNNTSSQQSSSEVGKDSVAQNFANLVAGAQIFSALPISSSSQTEIKSADARPSSVELSLKGAVKDVRPENKKENKPIRNKNENLIAEDKPAKETKRKEKTLVNEVNIAQEAQNIERPQNFKQSSSSKNDIDSSAEVTQENTSPIVHTRDGAEGFVAIVNESGLTLLPQGLDLDVISAMPQVTIFDAVSNETVSISGEDFAIRVQESAANGSLYMAETALVENMLNVLPAEIAAEETNRFLHNNAMATTLFATDEAITTEIDPLLVEQAKVLDGKLKDNQKLDVKVVVKEENFARSDNVSDLLFDKFSVEEVISSVAKENGAVTSENKNKAVNSNLLSNLQAQNVQTSQVDMLATAVVATQGMDTDIAGVAKAAGVESVSTLTSAHQSINNAIASQVLKPELSVKTEETSFRDVYRGMSREAVEQVKVNITKSAVKGVDKIDIQLKPEDLGHVQVKMQISKDGRLHAEIIASRQDTLDILQKEADTLQKAFADAGFDTDGSSFNFSFRGEEQQDQNSELRNFIGNVLEQEANEEVVSNDNQVWDPVQGLNIRV